MRFVVWDEGPKQMHEIGVQYRWIDLRGSKVPFAASLASASASKSPVRLGLNPRQGVGLFVFNEKHVHLDYLDAKWITTSAADRK